MSTSRVFSVQLLLGACALGATGSAVAQSTFEVVVRGSSCNQNVQGSLNCKYNVGKDLEFSIAAVGEPVAGVNFLHSNIKGDYYARYGVAHGCILVAEGEGKVQGATSEFAFVSPYTGRVYRSWHECRATRK